MSEARWDVILEGLGDDPTLKARVKRFTMKDGLEKTQLERRLIDASNTKGNTDREIALLYLVNNYPLLRGGIVEAEGFKLPLTADAFWKLPETFVMLVGEAIREVNPQYALPFSELLRMTTQPSATPSDSPSESTQTSGESDNTS